MNNEHNKYRDNWQPTTETMNTSIESIMAELGIEACCAGYKLYEDGVMFYVYKPRLPAVEE